VVLGITQLPKPIPLHRQRQLLKRNNNKANPPAKNKQPPPYNTFEGIASGINPMKGIVIADENGNKAGQFHVFQKKLAGAAAKDKAYGLDSAILDLTAFML
jgi:hypothetical protein